MAIGILLLGSLTDYPLRTPLLTAVLALLCVLLELGTVRATHIGKLQSGTGAAKER